MILADIELACRAVVDYGQGSDLLACGLSQVIELRDRCRQRFRGAVEDDDLGVSSYILNHGVNIGRRIGYQDHVEGVVSLTLSRDSVMGLVIAGGNPMRGVQLGSGVHMLVGGVLIDIGHRRVQNYALFKLF